MGCLTSALSVGSVIGSLLVGRIAHPKRIYLAVTSLLFGVAMGITAMTTTVVAAAVALMLTGVAAFAFVTLTSTTLQLHSSPPYRARIMALYGFFYLGTTPLGSIAVGWICRECGRSRRARRRRDGMPACRRAWRSECTPHRIRTISWMTSTSLPVQELGSEPAREQRISHTGPGAGCRHGGHPWLRTRDGRSRRCGRCRSGVAQGHGVRGCLRRRGADLSRAIASA